LTENATHLLQQELTRLQHVVQQQADELEALRRSNRDLEHLALLAAHDLQTPLRKIEMLSERLSQPPNQIGVEGEEYLQRLSHTAKRMRTLVGDLLSFARILESDPIFEEVDLESVIRQVIDDFLETIQETGATIEIGTLPLIEAVPSQMYQLFLNLLGNALKYRRPSNAPHVTIRAELGHVTLNEADLQPTPVCEVTITDNGIGFDPRETERIFDLFERLHGRHKYEGTGIGLAACRRIVERHSGRITASSQLGEGSVFCVMLPLRQEKVRF
jgi:light-regulated signal transduction histidine kinase (bacteriophytochrome)